MSDEEEKAEQQNTYQNPYVPRYCHLCSFQKTFRKELTRRGIFYLRYSIVIFTI